MAASAPNKPNTVPCHWCRKPCKAKHGICGTCARIRADVQRMETAHLAQLLRRYHPEVFDHYQT